MCVYTNHALLPLSSMSSLLFLSIYELPQRPIITESYYDDDRVRPSSFPTMEAIYKSKNESQSGRLICLATICNVSWSEKNPEEEQDIRDIK